MLGPAKIRIGVMPGPWPEGPGTADRQLVLPWRPWTSFPAASPGSGRRDDEVTYRGSCFTLDRVRPRPMPPPRWAGGSSEPALRRAGRLVIPEFHTR
jgi:alkanesulfonate monooxygenase SsuD/methylene tetrahydromethanopterin reductase-like flavin-dependent oxidoreductase (luciferase family)